MYDITDVNLIVSSLLHFQCIKNNITQEKSPKNLFQHK